MKKTRRSTKKKSAPRPVFDAIRKPLAPPGHSLGHAKPDDRARPAQRKVKHKQGPVIIVEDE